jgi:hypothetical protein
MQSSLMYELNERDMSAVIHTYNLADYYYPTIFPLKETFSLTWKELEAQAGLRIAGDIVSRGSTVPRKTREAVSRIQGDIPKIVISREKLENELTEYEILVSMSANNPTLKALVEYWAEDTKFCWDGVAARLEWIALRQISLGKVTLSNTNNAAVVTEFDLDYQIPTTQKKGVYTSYLAGVAGKPFTTDFREALAIGKTIGARYKYAFMNLDTFAALSRQEEVSKACATFLQNIAGVATSPSVKVVNEYLKTQTHLFQGLQIIVVDQSITIEQADGSRHTVNPFEDNVILFSESNVLGNTYYKTPIDARKRPGDVAEKVVHGHTLVQKYSEVSPLKEVTEGIANAFPAWNLAGRSLLLQTDATSWNKN